MGVMARRARWMLAVLCVAGVLCGGRARAGMLRGVNLSGAELGTNALPGRENTDYVYPDETTLHYFAAAGMNTVRLPVLWERLQPRLNAPLDRAALARLDAVVAQAHAAALRVIIDVHDYGMWRGQRVGGTAVPRAALAAFWGAYAAHLRNVRGGGSEILGLMNEPHDIDATAWAGDEQAAIEAIRQAGADNLILVSGVGWDGAHNFVSGAGYGTPNAVAIRGLHDPASNFAVEMHQYLDSDFSGTHAGCLPPAAARDVLAPATAWLRGAHLHGFLGEFAASSAPACLASLNALLATMDSNKDVWLGWTYWAAGPWWGDYMFSVQPKNGQDTPQMAVLRQHLRPAS